MIIPLVPVIVLLGKSYEIANCEFNTIRMSGELHRTEEEALDLLDQLEDILERDPLIDEVGYIHPSLLLALNEEAGATSLSSGINIPQTADVSHGLSEANAAHNKNAAFWNRDHKLGISTHYILPLYNAAKYKFMIALAKYRTSSDSYVKGKDDGDQDVPNSIIFSETEREVMRHSKALLLLSSDFGTAWNSRKLIGSKKQHLPIFGDELCLSTLVLSFAPKTEHAWSHRRWAIKIIACKCANLLELLEKESKLVEKIAEKSKMNYRAWNYRSWLVGYMSRLQVLHELNNSRNWAGLHVSDSSCFHYRRRLILRMLDDAREGQDLVARSAQFESLYEVWKLELDWNEILIKKFIGREALWLHRRFLSICWVEHFLAGHFKMSTNCDEKNSIENHLSNFMDHELCLLHYCSSIPQDEFEDVQAQAAHAAAYILRLFKQISGHSEIRLEEKLKDDDLRTLLNKVCPEKTKLWDSLLRLR
ncbi:hypothetical protein Nepgr_009665 [Nepenthes gracilis]|uniref:Protein prenyltransferase alpha subunit repeat-containing protein 1 n=1 Tax=Nepenthes gracilis TaxID=150966 RepID=A0AAD3SBM9_NEPGR|nr:hypothetical protein Nepgr_009665 [Nepenthes gracilis]